LPQNTVTGVVQTPDGYLWLSTFDGLARFDGVRFTIFDKGNTKGIVQ
jgi:ligand-binding sensor domain-containing protein